MNDLKFEMVFKGKVSPDEYDSSESHMTLKTLKHNLNELIIRAMNEGLITGDTSSTVDDYSVEINVEEALTIEEQIYNAAHEAAVIIPNDCESIRVDTVLKEDDGTTVIRGTGEDTTDEYSIDIDDIIASPQDFTIFKFTEIKIK